MIVVIGSPLHVPGIAGRPSGVAGLGPAIARSAAAAGATVQLVGKVGADPAGDATLLALARDGVGHVASLRDPAHATPIVAAIDEGADENPLADVTGRSGADSGAPALTVEPGDVDVALRYLDEFSVLVIVDPIGAVGLAVAAEAATYADAALVVLVPEGSVAPDLPRQATVLGAPDADPDGVFARTVGAFAAALDAGAAPSDALRAVTAAVGWEPATA
jgi:sugar/nucleoside kinase (ribokinase family)